MPLSAIAKANKQARTFSGEGSLNRLDDVLGKYDRVLVFNDANGFEPCGAEAYFKTAAKKLEGSSHFHFFPYAGKALPLEDIEAIYKEVRKIGGAGLITAVGGGTVIDLAKIISIAYSNNCEKVAEIIENKALDNTLDLAFIPTTAGTGSEATSFAVVYKDKVKLSIDKQSLLPDWVVLDPLLLKSLPIPVLNATVLDALAQAIESAWAKGTTPESRQYSKQAIKLVMENIDKEITIDRLSKLQMASHLAGKAINISRTTLPHSISYPMTSHFGVPHGIAVFLTLAEVARLNFHAAQENLQPGLDIRHIESSFAVIFTAAAVETIEQLCNSLEAVMLKLGVSTRLRDYGIRPMDLVFLADNALTKGRSDNNPRKVDSETVLKLLVKIF
jgi:alcohol dehydrogenase class IV